MQLPPEPITPIHNTSIQHHPDAAQLPTTPQQLSPTQVQTTENQAHSLLPSTSAVQQQTPTPTQSPTTQNKYVAQSPIIIADPPENPNPVSVHPMVTCFHVETNRPTERLNLHVSSVSPLSKSYHDAFNGMLSRYKARLVANGSTQLEGIDVDETFSPVVKPGTIWTVLSLATSRHWPIHQLDVNNAFLHGDLSETVYMHQPPRFQDSVHPYYVCLLQQSLYGLKQAPRAWFQRFASYITRVGFSHSQCDSSLFIYRQGTDTAYLLLYVDDIVLTASSEILLQQIIRSLHQEFAMTDVGPLNYFLGIYVTRDSSGLFLSEKKYAVEILDRVHMVNCNPSRTPIDTESKLGGDGDSISDPTLYRSLAGSLQYLAFTRPDISYALFSSSSTDLVAYSDVDWAGCPTTRRSTSGYYVFLGNNLLSWSSKRQPTLSRSSAEAEYRGVANVVAETCCLRNLLRELHTPLSSATLVYCDNVSAVYLSCNPVQHQRTKHIEIDIHFVRDLVAAGQQKETLDQRVWCCAAFEVDGRFEMDLLHEMSQNHMVLVQVCKLASGVFGWKMLLLCVSRSGSSAEHSRVLSNNDGTTMVFTVE
ncbi:ribonuclease H-like domain-containing protein [Tanacetum coccineum]